MTVEITYVALKPLRVGGQRREPGELVPEATEWPRVSAWISQGRLTPVARDAVDKDELEKAERRWAEAKADTQEPEPEPEQEPESDHEVETFAVGSGWYEIPGTDKKMRRTDAIAYLASLEDEEDGGEE